MKDSTKKEIEESIANLEKIGGNKNPEIVSVISRLRGAINLEDKKEDNGPGTKN